MIVREVHVIDLRFKFMHMDFVLCNGISQYNIHESSVGLTSTTNPKPKENPPTACSGKPMSIQLKAEPLRCLGLRTRGGRLKSSFVRWELSLPTQLSGSWILTEPLFSTASYYISL